MSGDTAAVSATFKEAMSAVTALREVEKAKKNDEFRTRLAIADLTMCVERVEQLWTRGIQGNRGGGQEGCQVAVADEGGHVDPAVPTSGESPLIAGGATPTSTSISTLSNESPPKKPPLSQFAATLSSLHERLDRVADAMSGALASAARGGEATIPLLQHDVVGGKPDSDCVIAVTSATVEQQPPSNNEDAPECRRISPAHLLPFNRKSSSISSKGGRSLPTVSLVEAAPSGGEEFASPSTSACFSPRHRNRLSSISIADSISFIPEEAFRPNADDLVSRGMMTQVVLTASTSTQAHGGHSCAENATSTERYVRELERLCSPDQIAQAKINAGR